MAEWSLPAGEPYKFVSFNVSTVERKSESDLCNGKNDLID